MDEDRRLVEVQRALCCLGQECRAMRGGDLSLCGASRTEGHARAVIAVCDLHQEMRHIRALVAIRREANKLCLGYDDPEAREILRLANDALGPEKPVTTINAESA